MWLQVVREVWYAPVVAQVMIMVQMLHFIQVSLSSSYPTLVQEKESTPKKKIIT